MKGEDNKQRRPAHASRAVSEAEAPYATEVDYMPTESPKEMADLLGVAELESVTSSFKSYSRLVQEAQDPDRRARCLAKAEYWRKVAKILWDRSHRKS